MNLFGVSFILYFFKLSYGSRFYFEPSIFLRSTTNHYIGDGWKLFVENFLEKIFYCVHLVGIFWYSLIFIKSYKIVKKRCKNEKNIDNYPKRKLCLSLINRFNNSKTRKKRSKTCGLYIP